MTPEYCAGLFDGEGHVEITNKLALRIRLSNTNKAVLKMLCYYWGGSIYMVHDRRREAKNWKDAWVWCASGQNARNFLSQILPFAVIKKAQIYKAVQLSVGIRGKRKTPAERVKAISLRNEIRALNHRGK